MKVTNIQYGKSYELQGYWEKISIDIQVDENELPNTVLDTAKNIVDGWHRDRNPDLYGGNVIEEKKTKLSGNIVKDIESVIELTVLKSYELICKNNPDLKKVYDKQFKKLSK